MQQIDNLSDSAMQLTKVDLGDGSILELALRYCGATQRWIMDVTRNEFTVKGVNVCVQPNMLEAWRNIIPFGLSCLTADGSDPTYFDDFLADPLTLLSRANLYVLSADEVKDIQGAVFKVGT